MRNILPDSVANISHAPPPTHDVPPSLIDIAENIIETLPGADKEELIKAFAAQLSFNDFQLAELEKVTRNQASSHYWWEQRKGRKLQLHVFMMYILKFKCYSEIEKNQ